MKRTTKLAFAIAALISLSGCFGRTPVDDGFRDTSVPLTVTTRGTAADLAGPWHMRAHFPGDRSLALVTFIENLNGAPAVEFLRSDCLLSGDCETSAEVWRSEPLGQNRYRLTNGSGERFELWVIWVDEGFRTAAIGTPDGSYGWVLDRKPTEGEDRIIAAREILSFNGYDTLRMIQK